MRSNDWLDTEVVEWTPPARSSMTMHTVQRNSLREVLRVLIHDGHRIALAFVLPLIATLLLALVPSPKYTSEATLLLRLGHEYLYKPEVGDANATAPMAYDRDQTLHAEVEILGSREIKETVLDRFGVAAIFPAIARSSADAASQRDTALLALQRSFDAVLVKDSNVVRLAFTHPDARVAANVLGAIIDAYLERRRSIFDNGSTGTARADVVALRGRLDRAEAELEALKRVRNIQSFGEQQSLLLAQSQSVEMRLADNAFALAQARGRAAALKTSLAQTPADIRLSNEAKRSEAVDSARKTLLDLQLKDRDLSSKFADDQPVVQDVRADIDRTLRFTRDLEAHPDNTVKTGRNPVRDAIESDLVRALADQRQATASRATLLVQRDAIDQRLTELGSSQRQLEYLQRERKMLESAFEGANKRLEDAVAIDHIDQSSPSSVRVVQPARIPLEAHSIRGVVIAVGLLISLACALLVAFLSALWRDTYLSPDDVQRSLGLPMLAAVPRVELA